MIGTESFPRQLIRALHYDSLSLPSSRVKTVSSCTLWVGIDRSAYAREMVLCSLAGMNKEQVEELREQTKDTDPDYVDRLLAGHETVFTSELPIRTDEGQEAAPNLAPVFSAKERSILTHAQMRQILFDQFGPYLLGL